MSAYFDWWDGRERRALLLDGERLTVGSAPDNDVVVGDASVSRIHAMLHQLNGRWFIEDCGSRNGTAVNGHQLTSMHPLRPTDEVRLGRARLVFCGQVSAGGNPTDAVVERPPITAREHDVLVALCRTAGQRRHLHRAGHRARDGGGADGVGERDQAAPRQPGRPSSASTARNADARASPTPPSTPASSRSPT